MNFYPVELSGTTSSGAWATNTFNITGGICYQIYVKFASDDTTFDFTLTDDKDNVIYNTADLGTTATGVLNVFTRLPMRGKYTVAIESASADEAFNGRLMIRT